MLDSSRTVSIPQIQGCLAWNWIVVVPNHCFCPGVNILDGPMEDCRGLLSWVYTGGLESILQDQGKASYGVDGEKVMAFGASCGGFLALSLGYDVPKPPKAILDFYGAVHFTHPFWTTPLPHVAGILPPLSADFIASGRVLRACFPDRDVRDIDPVWELLRVLEGKGVECALIEVPGEDHTFAMGMEVGSRTREVQREGFGFLERVISRRE
ncbi:hypothetical protein BBP40_009369 [Aspergillus hancockii]|nr:hypothetical protein BBP40_009369 [Aspergillus hancockii]